MLLLTALLPFALLAATLLDQAACIKEYGEDECCRD